ncbi:hypothetical protein CRUP_036205 [Coryphaenoides rupestris]|nr:hypothetical protein CRUP_036205 [Coryphaenoides rupestris]
MIDDDYLSESSSRLTLRSVIVQSPGHRDHDEEEEDEEGGGGEEERAVNNDVCLGGALARARRLTLSPCPRCSVLTSLRVFQLVLPPPPPPPLASVTDCPWTIRVRVTNKSNIRTWSNSRGDGKLFSMEIVDESGEIRITGFNQEVDKFYGLVEVGKVFYISKGTLKIANKQYSSMKNDYEMTLNGESSIIPCEDAVDLPVAHCDFVAISELEAREKDSVLGEEERSNEPRCFSGLPDAFANFAKEASAAGRLEAEEEGEPGTRAPADELTAPAAAAAALEVKVKQLQEH